MARNSTGTYTLPESAFTPNTTISSAAVNSNFSDIATALTQSLATTGVTSMTGPVKAASGSVAAPGYTFASDTDTGFWLAGSNQIGWAAGGVQGATFNTDLSVTWAGAATWGGAATFNGAVTINGATNLTGAITFTTTSFTFGAGAGAGFYTGIAGKVDIELVIDGGGSVVTTGQKGQIHVPFAVTITKWWVIADQSGSITVDVLRANNGVPSVSMVGAGNKPTLAASQLTSAAPSGWTSVALAADDFLDFNVSGPATLTRCTVVLTGTRIGA